MLPIRLYQYCCGLSRCTLGRYRNHVHIIRDGLFEFPDSPFRQSTASPEQPPLSISSHTTCLPLPAAHSSSLKDWTGQERAPKSRVSSTASSPRLRTRQVPHSKLCPSSFLVRASLCRATSLDNPLSLRHHHADPVPVAITITRGTAHPPPPIAHQTGRQRSER